MTQRENSLSTCLKYLQDIQKLLLSYLESDNDIYFNNLKSYFAENKISESKQDFFTFLCFISKISKNHHRETNFFEKMTKILLHFRPFFNEYCSNMDIFNIFKKNKLLLLILFKEKILLPDEEIFSIISSEIYKKRNYKQFFPKEFQSINDDKASLPDDFERKRSIGENDDLLCALIRNDDIDEFIKYIVKLNVDLSSKIAESIYETNSFLIGKDPTLIEYALFFGSIRIIRYMICNKVTFSSSSWLYCLHSKNYELIHLLEEYNVLPAGNSFVECLLESIKCQHNEIAEYIMNYKIEDMDNIINEYLKKKVILQAIRSHNYLFIPSDRKFLTSMSETLVLLTNGRYYKVINNLLTVNDGEGTFCSCLTGMFGENIISNLYCAVKNHDIEMIKMLKDANGTFNEYRVSTINHQTVYNEREKTTFIDSKTALYLAVEKRYYDIVEILLSNDHSNINKKSTMLYTHENIEKHNDKSKKFPIHAAVETGDNRILQLLLAYSDTDVNAECKIVKKLDNPFQYHLNTVEKKTALHIAVEKENIEAVRLLLSHKSINVNKRYSFKLNKILDGNEYDEDNQGNEEEEHQGDNERDKRQKIKKTALHMAVEKGNIEVVKLLLNHEKTDVNNRMKYKLIKPLLKIDLQKTALHIAIQKKDIDIVKLLLEQRSISINERVPYKLVREPKTLIHYNDDGEEIHNDDDDDEIVRKHDDCLKTPLHVAVQMESLEIIKLLLQQKSIDIHIFDGNGKLPIDYTDNPEIKALFPKDNF